MEKFLVFGILVVIGLILVVAIKGANELDDLDDGGVTPVAEAKEGDAGGASPGSGPGSRRSPADVRSRPQRGGPGSAARNGTPNNLRRDLPGPGREAPRNRAESVSPRTVPPTQRGENDVVMELLQSLGERGASSVAGGASEVSEAGSGARSSETSLETVELEPLREQRSENEARGNRAARTPTTVPPVTRESESPAVATAPPPVRRTEEGRAPLEPPVTGEPEGGWAYVVKPGDTLIGIAKRYLGSGDKYPEILATNPQVPSARDLREGQRLLLPSTLTVVRRTGLVPARQRELKAASAVSAAPIPRSAPSSSTPAFKRIVSRDTHRVAKGESLMSIARKAYGTDRAWQLVYQANRARLRSPDHIVEGQVLQLPREG